MVETLGEEMTQGRGRRRDQVLEMYEGSNCGQLYRQGG